MFKASYINIEKLPDTFRKDLITLSNILNLKFNAINKENLLRFRNLMKYLSDFDKNRHFSFYSSFVTGYLSSCIEANSLSEAKNCILVFDFNSIFISFLFFLKIFSKHSP